MHKAKRQKARGKNGSGVVTERANPASAGLDAMTSLEIAQVINLEDRRVPLAMEAALPQIALAMDAVAKAFRSGGRLIYVGAGTSGRLGALDASECPPTFHADPKMLQFVIAGGEKALGKALEAAEDSAKLGRRDMGRKRLTRKDVVMGLAASGQTPYTIGALEFAREKGCVTVAVTANLDSPLERAAEIAIAIDTGPEVVAGSTRMKAGTMQKLVCNMITTGAFARIGYVYGNLMVNVQLTNHKLRERGIGIVQQVCGCDRESAMLALESAKGSVPVALVMLQSAVGAGEARKRLKAAKGNVREAVG